MPTFKTKTQLGGWFLLLLSLFGCTENRYTVFKTAIEKARPELGNLYAAKNGTPFYTSKTLDPIWDENSPQIVRMPTFSLTDQNGVVRDKSLFAGQISVVGFFFITCHGFCSFLVSTMKKLDKEIGNQTPVRFVALTVDPEHDDPATLKMFARQQKLADSRWSLLTGNKDTIYSLAKDTLASQAFKRPASENGRSFVHSEHLYVIDSQGRLRGVVNSTRLDAPKEVQRIIARLSGNNAKT